MHNQDKIPTRAEESTCCSPSRQPSTHHHTNNPAEYQQQQYPDISTQSKLIPLQGGEFRMGTDNQRFPADGEGPIRKVRIEPFQIAIHPVTYAQFNNFATATGYITDAEKFGWSFVFRDFVSQNTKKTVTQVVQGTTWWWKVDNADWRQPDGPDSTWESRPDHPVTHISWHDAVAYCEWVDARLPTESEWEYAARGGIDQATYPWGDELIPDGIHMCNIWQGNFPEENNIADGYHGTSPVGNYKPNTYGIFDVAGNVWEWCNDWFSPTFHRNARRVTRQNPQGPKRGDAKVIRGGSYLCHESYCNRYRVGARTASTPDSSTGNMGFRIAAD